MTDLTTKKPMSVVGGPPMPYLRLPFSQLDDVRKLLKSHNVFHWDDERAFSWDGGPEMTVIYFGHAGNAAAVQAILDSVR
jgi:hypothetical protein